MKKYFMKGSDKELQFGDMIEVDLTKNLPDGSVKYHHLECKFMPDLVDILLGNDIIEEQCIDEEKDNDMENCPLMEEIFKTTEQLELRVENLESAINTLKALIKKVVA